MADETVFKFIYEEGDGSTGAASKGPPGNYRSAAGAPPQVVPVASTPNEESKGKPEDAKPKDTALGYVRDFFRSLVSGNGPVSSAINAARGAATKVVGGAVESVGKEGGIGKFIAALSPATKGLAAAGIAAAGVGLLAVAARFAAQKINEFTDRVAPYSAAIQSALARQGALDIQQNVRQGRELGPSFARFLESQSEFGREFRNFTGPLLAFLAESMTPFIQDAAQFMKFVTSKFPTKETWDKVSSDIAQAVAGDQGMDAVDWKKIERDIAATAKNTEKERKEGDLIGEFIRGGFKMTGLAEAE